MRLSNFKVKYVIANIRSTHSDTLRVQRNPCAAYEYINLEKELHKMQNIANYILKERVREGGKVVESTLILIYVIHRRVSPFASFK